MPWWLIRVMVSVSTVIAHGMAFLQFHQQIIVLPLPPEFGGQFDFLLLLSFLLALVLPFFRNFNWIWIILTIRGGILLLANQPLGSYLDAEATLLTVLIIEAYVYTSLQAGLIYALVLTALAINNHIHPMKAWGILIPPASSESLLFFGLSAGFIIAFSAFFRFLINNQIPAKELNRRLGDATAQLAQANSQLLEYAAIVEQEAVQNERKRMAREIHDTLAYTLTNLAMMGEAAKDMVDGAKEVLLEHLAQMHNLAKAGSVEVRRAIQALRPVQMNEVTGLPAVYRLVKAFEKATRIDVQLNLGNAPLFLGEEADLAVYRLVQEGMTNALRHGNATVITVSFSYLSGRFCVLIKDNGAGSSNFKEGYGLLGMRERIERLGGRLEVSNGPEGGFVLAAWIPLKENDSP